MKKIPRPAARPFAALAGVRPGCPYPLPSRRRPAVRERPCCSRRMQQEQREHENKFIVEGAPLITEGGAQ